MRFLLKFILIILVLTACSNDDKKLRSNPYLTNPVVNLSLNLNLPQYNGLKFPGNYVIASQGIKGIVVICVNENHYQAFDLTDPNHIPNDCSQMEIEGGIAKCPCPDDENEYFLFTGLHVSDPDSKYPMQMYRAERNGNFVNVRN